MLISTNIGKQKSKQKIFQLPRGKLSFIVPAPPGASKRAPAANRFPSCFRSGPAVSLLSCLAPEYAT
jgi:hypothetical protein